MDILYDIDSVKSKIKYYKTKNYQVGLVPTMGALHKGHLALVKKSLEENQITCCSIYVNPTQFNNPTDLQKYPKTIDQDVKLLEEAGCDIVFIPTDKDMYPSWPASKFSFGAIEDVMEGKFRPGHFNGVGIVVSKLFNIIKPDNAYFGQKDLQQFLVIKQMVKDLSYDINLKSVPIQRDEDGLALSSRNARLTLPQRKIAPEIYKGLLYAKELLLNNSSIDETKGKVNDFFNKIGDINLEYFEVTEAETLQPLKEVSNVNPTALCIAAYVGEVRLIDNLLLFS